jgi:protein-tyrosine-phosphatase
MARRGLDLTAHRSRPVQELDLRAYDQVWCMTSAHAAHMRARGVPAARLAVVAQERGGVPDPFGGDLAAYEACALVLEDAAGRIARAAATRR